MFPIDSVQSTGVTPRPEQFNSSDSLQPSRSPQLSSSAPLKAAETPNLAPTANGNGSFIETRQEIESRLLAVKKKVPLQDLCSSLELKVPRSATLDRLRSTLLNFWYPSTTANISSAPAPCQPTTSLQPQPPLAATTGGSHLLVTAPTSNNETIHVTHGHSVSKAFAKELIPPLRRSQKTAGSQDEEELDIDEEELVDTFDIDQTGRDILGYDEDEDNGEDELDLENEADFEAFKTKLRVDSTKLAEGNRRPGGLKTQEALVKLIFEFQAMALATKKIRDVIIDEHYMLLLIEYTATRPKRTRRGLPIPGTFVGASQQKKIFFAALRLRKQQEADDPTLRTRRPATSVTVWDLLKTRMDTALTKARCGLIPGEDAVDIIANTFLSKITEEQILNVGLKGFLMHRELRSTVFGHLAWVAQHATGNRGDDFRALKLAELQPHTLLHPNKETAIPSFIAHLHPEQCLMGAFAFYFHYLFDYKKITEQMDIDWSVNKSWRQARVLHGPSSPTAPFSEQSMYNMYFIFPGIFLDTGKKEWGNSRSVDSVQTSKLGWSRNSTYHDVYAPAIPLTAVLGAAGYKEHEDYNPVWRHVHVPEQFLLLMCPMAEEIHDSIVGKKNLSGAANFWSLAIQLRPFLFQCGAAIYQRSPDSNLFKLPALANPDVQSWMKNTFPTALSVIRANAGSPVDLQRIQNESLRLALEEVRVTMNAMNIQLRLLTDQLNRRTQVLSPAQGYSIQQYQRSTAAVSSLSSLTLASGIPSTPPKTSGALLPAAEIVSWGTTVEATGVYEAEDSTLRAYVSSSPKTPVTPRSRTQVDLVLPPVEAFSKPNAPRLIWPPVLGQRGVRWLDVFKYIEQPKLLWACYQPSKSLDQWEGLDELWSCWTTGEPVMNGDGVQTGVKPPLRELEQHFQSHWRKGSGKKWERFREIPEFIERESANRNVSPAVIMTELEARQTVDKIVSIDGEERTVQEKIGLNALKNMLADERKRTASISMAPFEGTTTIKALADSNSTPDDGSVSETGSTTFVNGNLKKRAKAIGARRPAAGPSCYPVCNTIIMGEEMVWKVLEPPQAHPISLLERSTFTLESTKKPMIIAIDARYWMLRAQERARSCYRQRKNEDLRYLLTWICKLRTKPVVAIFVFDGPNAAQRVDGPFMDPFPEHLIVSFQRLVKGLGFYVRVALEGVAEELAQIYQVDAVLTEDVKALAFGVKVLFHTDYADVSSLIYLSTQR
ncbi:hypothetical protein BDP27DRAFT_1369177 [Rhodocollybia butyracea]|uniref:Uncharacterized protein n=1 Tax=Rhodocollybia butyracea TaxID=206335 RepID=A0A9P5U0M8_9AGAR|nr:hypothetical protein BDP27DRAFT_1369177 [Rhodocollybia butyracea]